MATYLLLRNNKESGPYTVESLLQLGLKPYDLVWEHGRSAAWRYPSEIDALKSYAPAVEEQPFDRFYKKPAQLQKEKEEKQSAIQLQEEKSNTEIIKPIVQEIVVEIKQEPVQEIKRQEEIIEVAAPKKQVYVSMPANSTTGKTVFIKKTEPVTAKAAGSNSATNDLYKTEELVEKKAEPVITSRIPSYTELVDDYNNQQYNGKKIPVEKKEFPGEEEPAPVLKYVQSLDEIKDKYAQTLADRKKKTANRRIAATLIRKVLPFAAVLIAGVLMGVFFMNKKSDKEISLQTRPAENTVPLTENKAAATKPDTALQTNTGQVQEPSAAIGETTQQQLPANKTGENYIADVSKVNVSQTEQKNVPVPGTTEKKNLKNDRKVNSPEVTNAPILTQPKSVETDPVTGERNKVVRTASEVNNNTSEAAVKQTANTLMKQVSVASNEYKRGSFGGIHDLQLTVTNNSNYLLDNVIVEMQLLKPNDEPLKTDNIRFSPVPPNGSLTLAIPPTNRGVKVVCKVIHVDSKSAVNDTAGLK